MTARINLNAFPLKCWTKQALILEVERLREQVALYQEGEAHREEEALKRQGKVVVIDGQLVGEPLTERALFADGPENDWALMPHVRTVYDRDDLDDTWPLLVRGDVLGMAPHPNPLPASRERGWLGDPNDFLLPGELSVKAVHDAYRSHDAAKAAAKAVFNDTV